MAPDPASRLAPRGGASPSWERPGERLDASGMGRLLALRPHHAARDLVALDGLEQRLEVALAETVVALALDELEEHRAEQRLREDLQQQARLAALRVAIEQDATRLQLA